MKRVELLELENLMQCDLLDKMNEIIERLNSLLPETPEPQFEPAQVLWYREANVFATALEARVNKMNVVEYDIMYHKDGRVHLETVVEGLLKIYRVKEQMKDKEQEADATAEPFSTDDTHYTGRQTKKVRVVKRGTAQGHVFPNYIMACEFMGRSTAYLSQAKADGRTGNKQYRWTFLD